MRKYTRDQHPISRQHISDNALKVLYRLHNNNYDAYLVGGCVRDLFLGIQPKDFDVVTNATPEQIQKLFKNCRLVGRRFRLAHILFGRDIIEVATFRAPHSEADEEVASKQAQIHQTGRILRDNVYGSIEEDAFRRDFTINALYYSIADFAVYDFVGGMADIQSKTLRLIGEPEARYREDPVRMLRTMRFATKLNIKVEPKTLQPIPTLAPLLKDIPPARLFDEALKLFLQGNAQANFTALNQNALFAALFPFYTNTLKDTNSYEYKFIQQAFANSDQRVLEGKTVTPAFLFAVLLWYPLQARAHEIQLEASFPEFDAYQIAAADTLALQARTISIPRRFSLTIRDIWILQLRLKQTSPSRVKRLMSHPKLRAAYDFLCLRASTEQHPELEKLVQFWSKKVASIPETPPSHTSRKRSKRFQRRPRKR